MIKACLSLVDPAALLFGKPVDFFDKVGTRNTLSIVPKSIILYCKLNENKNNFIKIINKSHLFVQVCDYFVPRTVNLLKNLPKMVM